MLSEKEYKEAKNDSDFTNLRSDVALRQKVSILTFENPSDERGVEIILKQPTLSAFQRNWLNTLLKRKGKKFVG